MKNPHGGLSAAQYEIMEAVWPYEAEGATVAEIWDAIGQGRKVTRTTVLNLVSRLEKRGWLVRREAGTVSGGSGSRANRGLAGRRFRERLLWRLGPAVGHESARLEALEGGRY
jgi:DNA-binding MarR family transcriptional regulator